MKRCLLRFLLFLAVVGGTALWARSAFDLYVVPTPSMWPTIAGEDLVLVDSRPAPLSRFDLVIFENDGKNFVKRAIGLPGETLQVRGEDIWIGGSPLRKPARMQRAAWRPIGGLDARGDRIRSSWEAVSGEWAEADGRLTGGPGLLRLKRDVPGEAGPARDFALHLEWAGASPGARLEVLLRAAGEEDRFSLPVGDGGPPSISRNGERPTPGSAPLAIGSGWARLFHLDAGVGADVGGAPSIRLDCDSEPPGPNLGNLVEVTLSGGSIGLERIALLRDIDYSAGMGPHGREPYPVPDGSCFLMGDNPRSSMDSRSFGAVAKERLKGRVLMTVWPLERIEWLR